MPKLTRGEVFRLVNGERAYQDAGEGNAARHVGDERNPGSPSGGMSPGEGLLCIEKITADARDAWYKGVTGAVDMMPFIRKLTAVGVQLMENYGAPPRAGYENAQPPHRVGILPAHAPECAEKDGAA